MLILVREDDSIKPVLLAREELGAERARGGDGGEVARLYEDVLVLGRFAECFYDESDAGGFDGEARVGVGVCGRGGGWGGGVGVVGGLDGEVRERDDVCASSRERLEERRAQRGERALSATKSIYYHQEDS